MRPFFVVVVIVLHESITAFHQFDCFIGKFCAEWQALVLEGCLVSCHIQTQLLQQTIGGINECVEAQQSCLRGKIARTSNACFSRGVCLITDFSCLQNEEYGNSSFPTRAFSMKSPPTSRPVSISGERIWSGFKSYEWEN